MLTKLDIFKAFRSIGTVKGDVLILQSSYKGCYGIEGGPKGLVEVLLDLLGSSGTLIMPAYNFHEWTEKHYFDILETKSEVGVITELFRQREGVGRTIHPIHSLSVYGKYQKELTILECQNSFGPTSVYARLLELNALYATIGLGDKMPFLQCHFTEEEMQVPYRRIKDFGGIYVGKDRKPSLKTYGFPVRLNEKQPVFEGHKKLVEEGKIQKIWRNKIPFFSARAKQYHQDFKEYIEANPHLFMK